MKQIVLLCANGMSTSLMVAKMKSAAQEMNYECSIEAHSIDDVKDYANVDIILLGPQVKFQQNKVTAIVNCPVQVMDMMAYGMMDGKKILTSAINEMEK